MEVGIVELEQQCIRLLDKIKNCHSKNAFRSALIHLDKAQALYEIDKEMCVFRAITAEEEAASGLMLSLKEGRYELSDKLKHRDHVHKSAIYPFISLVQMAFAYSLQNSGVKLGLAIVDNEHEFSLKSYHTIPGYNLYSYPIPPLNFEFKLNGDPISYDKQISDYLEHVGAADIVKYVKDRANVRNKVLYASNEGCPGVEIKMGFVEAKKRKVLEMLKIYLLIKPHAKKQLFVQQSIYAYLKMLKAISSEVGLVE